MLSRGGGLSHRRDLMRSWADVGLAAVEPRRLTREALGSDPDDVTVIGIGKAGPGMCWGAHEALGRISGICVTNADAVPPPGVELVLGDHPVPGERSFQAGQRLMEVAARIDNRCLALISGGGSSVCEYPRIGIDPSYLTHVCQVMIDAGVAIDEMNLVRQHLSGIKGGGLAAVVSVAIETYVISDVGRRDVGWVASGPTIPFRADPERVEEIMRRCGIEIDDGVRRVIRSTASQIPARGSVAVLANGRTAGEAIVRRASEFSRKSAMSDRWIEVDVASEVTAFLEGAPPGVTVGVGEPTIRVDGPGRGGRNTHAALMAATLIEGRDDLFMAFATDGIDGRSGAGGAIVDGTTIARGGNPDQALQGFDSARYLARTADLITTGPTGTNVADVWVLWRR